MFRTLKLSCGIVLGFALLFWAFGSAIPVLAQNNNNNNNNSNQNNNNNNQNNNGTNGSNQGTYYGGSVVGGVEIDLDRAIKPVSKRTMEEVGKNLAKLLEPIPADLSKTAPIRKISLKKLDAQMIETIKAEKEFPDSVRYLGGLTAIRYIVVVPEENDILLVGPSEAWQADPYGNVVGKSSGRPVFRLEDMLTLFRTWNHQERPSVITCSIDPTAEALVKIIQVEKEFAGITAKDIRAYAAAKESAYGMNIVTLQGIPEQSRIAMVLVLADYRMKQIGLGHEPAPIRNLPSYTSLIHGSQKQVHPRFWLAPEYGTVSHDSRKLTWQLSEVNVKALTDDEYIDSRSHSLQSSGKLDKTAVNWCSKMTNNYAALSKADPVFGDLKNCMELAIAVALIQREGLLEKANCKLAAFEDEKLLPPTTYPVPKKVPSRAMITQNGRTPVVACGGIEVNPFITLQNVQLDSKIDNERKNLVQTTGDAWWSK